MLKEVRVMGCPVCNGTAVGKVGVNQFYCWNCFVEFSVTDEQVKVFEVAEDGSLSSYAGSSPELV